MIESTDTGVRVRRRACFISQRPYPTDQRLYTEISALQRSGYDVHVICTKNNRPPSSVEDGVHIHRVPSIPRKRGSIIRYLTEYASFLLSAFVKVTYLHARLRFDLVHVTNLPDFLVMAAFVPRLLGARVVFDVRECSPEMCNDRLGMAMDGRAMKLIIAIEQWAVRFAHATVTCTEQMKNALVNRGADPEKIFVVLNVSLAHHPSAILPDRHDHSPAQRLRLVTHGTIIKRYGHRLLIEAMPYVLNEINDARLEILGRGEYRPTLEAMVARMNLQHCISFAGFIPDCALVDRLRRHHLGIVSLEQNPEADLVHTHKMFEYIALGIPVVISRTTAVRAYFEENELAFYDPGDQQDLARVIVDLARNPEKRYELAVNALKKMDLYSPAKQQRVYAGRIETLLCG